MPRIWGLDLGTASVGFSVVDIDEAGAASRVVHLGSRIFPEGVEEKKKEPRNQKRRAARLIRRQVRRRRWRRLELRRLLVEAGLLPREELNPDPTHSSPLMAHRCPYELRARGINERLEPYEVGRAIFHLAKHRGFTGSRKFGDTPADTQQKKDEGKVKGEIASLRGQMGGRHLGEFLGALPPPERKRGRHIGRDMVKEEFDALWEKQASYHPALLNAEVRKRLTGLIFFQRPTFWRLNTIGKCELEPNQERCLKGDWYGQRFVMLQMLNSLRLESGRPLSEAQRAQALSILEAKDKDKFEQLRRKLDLKNEQFNFEVGGEKNALGNATEQRLVKVFGAQWPDIPARDRIRDEIADRLWDVEYRRVGNKRAEIRDAGDIAARRRDFARAAEGGYAISAEQAKALSEIELPQGWLNHSKRAILNMLPDMEAGRRYDEAKSARYPARVQETEDPPSRLDEPPSDIRNPTVMRTLHELQKVVNNLLRVCGPPGLIRIELARDLKLPREKRNKVKAEQSRNKESRKKAREELEPKLGRRATFQDVEKYLLAEECGWRCPYTGAQISFGGLFHEGLFEVDHIRPYSRSFDDSFMNKTVCHCDANKEKGNRTPFEAFGNPERWPQILKRIHEMKSNGFLEAKIARIKREERLEDAESEEFTNRQLADTSYAASAARDYLATLGRPVEVTNGRATATLRRLWGLGTVLSDAPGGKNRDDHRHHAIDALVTALTTRTFIQRASGYYSAGREAPKEAFPMPWARLHEDAVQAISAVVVSHRAQRKISGPLHEETRLGDTGEEVTRNGVTYSKYVFRKSLKDGLTKGELDSVADPVVREPLRQHVEEHGGNPKTAFKDKLPTLPSRNGAPVPIRRVRIQKELQASLVKPLRPDASAFAEGGSNHHIVIFRNAAGKPDFRVVSMFDAAMRLARREPVIDRMPEPGATFLMSLCIGDSLERIVDGRKTYWTVEKIAANGQVTIQPHNLAQELGRTGPVITTLVTEKARKVVVDPIGRVAYAND